VNAKEIKMDKGAYEVIKYSDKSIAVHGEGTRALSKTLKAIGGKFVRALSIGDHKVPGWVFPLSKEDSVKAALTNPTEIDLPSEESVAEAAAISRGAPTVVKYSEKAIAVFGNSRKFSAKFKDLNGRYNPHLEHPQAKIKMPGWIFSSKRKADVLEAIAAGPHKVDKVSSEEEKTGKKEEEEYDDDEEVLVVSSGEVAATAETEVPSSSEKENDADTDMAPAGATVVKEEGARPSCFVNKASGRSNFEEPTAKKSKVGEKEGPLAMC